MSPSYKTVKSDRQWRATTGVSKHHFVELSNLFKQSYLSIFGEELCERAANPTIEVKMKTYEDYVFFLLFSLKSGLTYDALGFVFNLDGSHARQIQQRGLRILKAALHQKQVMPKRFFKSPKEFKELFEQEEKLLIDGTECQVQRPKDQIEQKDFYSGKKNSYREKFSDK